MEAQEVSSSKPSIPAGLGIIEKAREIRWTLQIAAAVLFADLLLVWWTGNNITQWSTSADQLMGNSGFLVTGTLAFAVLMSIVLPLVGELFRLALWELIIEVPWPSWMLSERDYRRQVGMVYPHELHDHALKKGDKLLLDIYTDHEHRMSTQESEKMVMAQMVFALLVLGGVDFFASELGFHGRTMLQEWIFLFGRVGEITIALGLVLAMTALKKMWFSLDSTDWIYYPPLYEEIEAERKRREDIARTPRV